jgi:hypothetical protein
MTLADRAIFCLYYNLALSPAQRVIDNLHQDGAIASHEQQLQFAIDYAQEPEDPRELSEIPEVRLWLYA